MELKLYAKQIFLYRKPIDFRAGIDGLCFLVQTQCKRNPEEGIYLFLNKKRDKLKLLSWHKNGFVLCYKRLEKDLFRMSVQGEGTIEISPDEMTWLLAGLEWEKMRHWRELNYSKFS